MKTENKQKSILALDKEQLKKRMKRKSTELRIMAEKNKLRKLDEF